jgi:hypothetical protein
MGFGPKPARLLTAPDDPQRHLPQGAPTSDAIAIQVLRPFDRSSCHRGRLDVALTRYLDNIDVSGVRTREAIPEIVQALRRHCFAVRKDKILNVGPQSRKPVCTDSWLTGRNTSGRGNEPGATSGPLSGDELLQRNCHAQHHLRSTSVGFFMAYVPPEPSVEARRRYVDDDGRARVRDLGGKLPLPHSRLPRGVIESW